MKLFFLIIFVLVVVFGVYGVANTMTVTGANPLKTLKISSSDEIVSTLEFLENVDVVDKVKLTFDNAVENETVAVSIKNKDSTEIGSGSTFVATSETVVTITLSNTVTANERTSLSEVVVTIT